MSVKVDMKPTSVIKARLGLGTTGRIQKFFTHTCAVHMDKYVPYRTGTLATTVVEEDTKIIYPQTYAIYPYKGITRGKEMNYNLDKHAFAGPYWDKRMWSAEKNEIVKEVQKELTKHGGK